MKQKPALMKLFNFLLNVCIVYIVAHFVIFDDTSLWQWYSVHRTNNILKSENARYENSIAKLEKERDAVENDPKEWERIAREKYGMQHSDDIIYEFVDENETK